MVKFFKVILAIEADSYKKTSEKLSLALNLKSGDVWIGKTSEMTGSEVLEFFGQTIEDMEKESNEY